MPDERRPWFRNLGLGLGVVRELRGLTQVECAKRAGLTRSQPSRYETGLVPPTLENLGKVLHAVGLSAAEFFFVVGALDLLAAGEPIAAIPGILEARQRAALELFLGELERVARKGGGKGSLARADGRCPSVWPKILSMANLEDPERGAAGLVWGLHEKVGEGPGTE